MALLHTTGFQHFAHHRVKISEAFTVGRVVTTNSSSKARKLRLRDVRFLGAENGFATTCGRSNKLNSLAGANSFSFSISGAKQASLNDSGISFIKCGIVLKRQANACTLGNSRASRVQGKLKLNDGGRDKRSVKAYGGSGEIEDEDDDGPLLMDDEEREEWRRKIREVIDAHPNVEEEVDPVERNKKMQKLLADYPLVVEEDDPDWPEDADGWGFNLGQFFNKISIKNVKKDDDDEDDIDSENKVVWQDDDYIRPIKDITSMEWEETVFKDISPLIVFVHNRYKRPKENEKMRDELEKAVNIIWNCRLPSPRCVAIDGVVELDLISALQVSTFPELIFTKAGKILYRDKGNRTADELSKIMAYFYYGAAKPPGLNNIGKKNDESIPFLPLKREQESPSINSS